MAENNKLNAEYLFYDDNSPVQWGSFSQIKDYIRKHSDKAHFKENLNAAKEFEKEINLGTHAVRKMKDIGQYHRSIVPYKNACFAGDLMDILGSSKTMEYALEENDSYVWLLLVINTQTKMLYFRKMRRKTGDETARNLYDIFRNDIGLKDHQKQGITLEVDSGKEFFNAPTERALERLNIHIYASFSRHKSSVVERVILTIRKPLTKAMESRGWKWIDMIAGIVSKYNNRHHRTIQMTPSEADKNFPMALFNIKRNFEALDDKIGKYSQKFNKDDCVRVRVHFPGEPFKKGSHRQYSAEVFYVYGVYKTPTHAVYKLVDSKGTVMKGSYNDNDVIRAKTQEYYNVIVLKKRRRLNKIEYLVEYDGFKDYGQHWINETELKKQ